VAGGLFSINVPGSDLAADADTTVDASVTTTDTAGNGATATDSQVYAVDTTAPTITISDIAGDNFVNDAEAAADIVISGTTTGVEDGQVVTLTLLDAGNNVIETVTTSVSGNAWSYTVTAGTIPGGSDGTYTVLAEVTDLAGNPASDTQDVTLDTSADTDAVVSVTIDDGDGFINDAEDDAVDFTVAGVDGDATATVTFTSSGGGTAVIMSGLVNGTSTVDLSGLNDGTVTATISVTDTAGNTTSGTGDTSILDTIVAASITLDDVTADNVVDFAESGANVAVTGSVGGDVQDGDTITLTVNGNDYTGAVAGGLFSIDVAGSELAADGDLTVDASVTTTDLAGNSTTATDTQSYDVDTAPPNPNVALLEDVIWQHTDGTVRTATTVFGTLPTTEIAAGDFDSDGDSDVIWHISGTQEMGIWEIQDGAFVQTHDLPTVPHTWEISATGDFDGDGDDDIAWHHFSGLVVNLGDGRRRLCGPSLSARRRRKFPHSRVGQLPHRRHRRLRRRWR
jgi:Bacterial Ig-like domain